MTIDRARDMLAMEEYNSSFSMKGVCVELTVVVRPRCLVKTLTTAYPTDASLPGKLLQVRQCTLATSSFVQSAPCTIPALLMIHAAPTRCSRVRTCTP